MDTAAFLRQFENAIEGLTPGSMRPETVLRELPQWDSLALLNILAMVDMEYGVQVSGLEIQACRTLQDLADLVGRKRG